MKDLIPQRYLLVLGTTASLFLAGESLARTVVEDGELTVTTSQDSQCRSTADLSVHAGRPDVYAPSASRLQTSIDAALAVLLYECPRLETATVRGRLHGLEEVLYEADVRRQDSWLLAPTRSVEAEGLAPRRGASSSSAPRARQQNNADTSRYDILGLRLGITPEEALKVARAQFRVEPDYDPARGVLRVREGQCRGSNARPGAECVIARFDDPGRERLEQLRYVQVIDAQARDALISRLEQRYGKPANAGARRGGKVILMSWGDVLGTNENGKQVHRLEARVRDDGSTTTLRLTLRAHGADGLQAAAPPDTLRF